jgi:predicted enzyme related to lactoylglutathione lyase
VDSLLPSGHNAGPNPSQKEIAMPSTAAAPSYRGRFLWYELMTNDVERAGAFYSKVLDWGQKPFPGLDTPYTIFESGATPVAGLMELPANARSAGVPPNWLSYIGVPDVDASVKQATSLGGQVHMPPFDVPTVGRLAVLVDPQGAAFAVYTPTNAPGPETDPPVGHFSWNELTTTDLRAAFSFYQEMFGWENQQEMDMGENLGVYLMFGRPGGAMLGGIYNRPPDMAMPPNWLPYARVADVNTYVSRVTADGGQVLNGPMEVPGGDMIAQCLDPTGAAFAIHSKGKG